MSTLPSHARPNVDFVVRQKLDESLRSIEFELKCDVVTIYGPILYGADYRLRDAIESLNGNRQHKVAVVLDTPGGVVEIVERMVELVRWHYAEVLFVIPDRAMSAGTVFAMSGDAIMMDYFSRLGPIDPQIEKDGRLVPALSYLVQYRRLLKRARRGELSNAEFALLAKFDLAEIHQYEQARNLTRTLLGRWLVAYKFKHWYATRTRGIQVDDAMRRTRADEIATALSDNVRWHSHGRGISMDTLRDELNLVIDDMGSQPRLNELVHECHGLLRDYLTRINCMMFMHTRNYF